VAQVGIYSLYLPTQGVRWAYWWGRQQPRPFLLPAVVLVGITGGLLLARGRQVAAEPEQPVRWATRRSLRKAGLFAKEGVVLGTWRGKTVCYGGETHTLMVAPSGGGKTQSVGIPTALTWRGSLVLHDPKNELYPKTAGWRSTFSRVVRLDPTDPTSDFYDPSRVIRLGQSHEIRDGLLVADMLTNPDGEPARGGSEQHFRDITTDVLLGVVLHGLYTRQSTTLVELDHFFMSEATLDTVLHEMG
jgi:type IV secretion system protein VirD4